MRLGPYAEGGPARREPFLPSPGGDPVFAARPSLSLLSRPSRDLKLGGLGLFAGVAVVAHLLAIGTILALPGVAGFFHRPLPPPDHPISFEVMTSNDPVVTGGKVHPTDAPRQQKAASKAPSVLSSPSASDTVPAGSARAAAAPPAETASSQQAEVNLGQDDETGAGSVVGDNVVPPSADDKHPNLPPRYPITAQERGEQGTTTLVITVAPDGHATDVTVAASSGHALLDAEARRAALLWHFRPEIRDGQPVQSFINYRIEFGGNGPP